MIWKSAVPGGDVAAYASAIVTTAARRKQYVQFLDKGVVGVDAKTGQFLWRYDATSKGPANIATPLAHDGYIYSTNSRRFGAGLVQLHATADGVAAEQVYFERDLPNTLGGQVRIGKYIYGTNPQGPACAEFVTGKLQWHNEGIGPGGLYMRTVAFIFTARTAICCWSRRRLRRIARRADLPCRRSPSGPAPAAEHATSTPGHIR